MAQPKSMIYKPIAIRTGSLIFFAIVTLVLLALLVAATRGSANNAGSQSQSESCPGCSTAPPVSFFTSFGNWSGTQYFTATYLPTMLAVFYSAFWDILYLRMREMEPFFQLARPEGVSAESSILLHYASSSLPVVLYRSVVNDHSRIILAAFVSLLLTISIPFASEVLHITTSGNCAGANAETECVAKLEIRVPIASLEAAFLGITFCVIAILSIAYARRPNMIRGEVSSIAGMATLLQDLSFLNKIRRVSRILHRRDREAVLSENFYALADVQAEGSSAERLVSIQLRPRVTGSSVAYSSLSANQEKPRGNIQGLNQKSSRPPLVMSRIVMSFVGLILLGLLALIIYYRIPTAGTSTSGFESFMDSQSMGIRFMMTSLGVLIKFYWTSLEREIRNREPYRRLAVGKAKPQDSILIESRSHPITALFVNISKGRFFLAYLAFTALLSEVLTVALAGVPFSSSQSYRGWLVSIYLSIVIIVLMLIALALAIFRRDSKLQLPYPLRSIVSTMLYLCNSSMLEDFKDLSSLDMKTRNRRIVGWGKRYKYDRLADLDGGVTFGVDYDESWQLSTVEEFQISAKR